MFREGGLLSLAGGVIISGLLYSHHVCGRAASRYREGVVEVVVVLSVVGDAFIAVSIFFTSCGRGRVCREGIVED